MAQQMAKKDNEIKELHCRLEEVRKALGEEQVGVSDLETLQKYLPVWTEKFNEANSAQKKMMLSLLIKKVTVWTDRVQIDFGVNTSAGV